jgi:DNA ligase D-like protein (predicted 3'-phosphoesterase)
MGLDEYKTKRNFQKTREPEGKESEGTQPIFVVQEHHASHLHYDFRLALDGVLKSWAIPKGIPEEPKVRKLAVQTEDHPLGYEGFEGSIPKGEYGAGEVKIWDKGSFQLKERSPDKLVFVLVGERLKGTYALVRFKGKEKDTKNWLIMKL